jgi:hypothetical protein
MQTRSLSILAALTWCALCLATSPAASAQCTASSGPQRVALLELFTSEGCDSCPPADKWVGELPLRDFGSDRVVALAFHVDYWNQLGWIDPFAQAAFGERQRRHSKRRGVSFVVTPQLLLNGQDYRAWGAFDDFSGKLKAINASNADATIRVTLEHHGALMVTRAEVTVGTSAQQQAQVFLALYENNLLTPVTAGENRGRTLRHDFVVRSLVGPLPLDEAGKLSTLHRFALDKGWKTRDLNVAVFVQHPHTGDVLQALTARCH